MSAVLRRFFSALTDEERPIRNRLSEDRLGLILRSGLNEVDWYHYNLKRAEAPTGQQQEEFYLLSLGIPRLIQLALESRPSFDASVVTFVRTRQTALAAFDVLARLGIIEHGRRVAQTVAAGVGRIDETKANDFLITLPPVVPDDQFYERALSEHYRFQASKRFDELLNTKEAAQTQREVDRLLSELVYPFEKHFIGYDAHPLLDEFFFAVAF